MVILRNSLIILFNCFLTTNIVSAKIIWNRDLIDDPNTSIGPLASCVNDDNSISLITKMVPRGSLLHKEGNCILWKLKPNGAVQSHVLLKDESGNPIATNTFPIRSGCAMNSDGLGNLMTASVFEKSRRTMSLTILQKSDVDTMDPNIIPGDQIRNFSLKKMVPFKDHTFLLAGEKDKDGLYLRIDNQGAMIKEVPFDMGQSEKFTGVTRLKPDHSNIALAGLSFNNAKKEWQNSIVENFILIYDPNDNLLHEDYFPGVLPGITFPKTCSLGNGHIVLTYFNRSESNGTGLWARCYTQELKLLWEKKLFSADSPSFVFDMASHGLNGFMVATITPGKSVDFFSYNNIGNQVDFCEYKGQVGISGFNLMHINGKIIAVFEEVSLGMVQDFTIKTKVLAVD